MLGKLMIQAIDRGDLSFVKSHLDPLIVMDQLTLGWASTTYGLVCVANGDSMHRAVLPRQFMPSLRDAIAGSTWFRGPRLSVWCIGGFYLYMYIGHTTTWYTGHISASNLLGVTA